METIDFSSSLYIHLARGYLLHCPRRLWGGLLFEHEVISGNDKGTIGAGHDVLKTVGVVRLFRLIYDGDLIFKLIALLITEGCRVLLAE